MFISCVKEKKVKWIRILKKTAQFFNSWPRLVIVNLIAWVPKMALQSASVGMQPPFLPSLEFVTRKAEGPVGAVPLPLSTVSNDIFSHHPSLCAAAQGESPLCGVEEGCSPALSLGIGIGIGMRPSTLSLKNFSITSLDNNPKWGVSVWGKDGMNLDLIPGFYCALLCHWLLLVLTFE